MNGTDTILAVVVIIALLIFVPLRLHEDCKNEMVYVILKNKIKENGNDPAEVLKIARLLGIEPEVREIGLEGEREEKDGNHVFIEYDPEKMTGKGILYYGF